MKVPGFSFINTNMPNNNFQTRYTTSADVLKNLPGDFLNDNSFQPESNNPLTNNKFQFVIGKCPRVTYFCQRANIPSLSFGTSIQSNPTGVVARRPGTSYIYEDLQVGFFVDDKMKNWLEIHDWMKELGINYGPSNETLNEHQKVSSAFMYVLNAAYKPLLVVKYKNIYPTFLSGIDFDASLTDVDSVIATATFSYTHYEIEVFENNP